MAAETIPGGEGQKRLLTQFVRIVRRYCRHLSRPLRGSIELKDRFLNVGANIVHFPLSITHSEIYCEMRKAVVYSLQRM